MHRPHWPQPPWLHQRLRPPTHFPGPQVGRTDLISPLLSQSTASAGQQQQHQQQPEADAAAKVLLTGGGSISGGGSAGEAMEVDAVDERKPAEKAARNTCCVVKGAGGAHTAVGMEVRCAAVRACMHRWAAPAQVAGP